MEDYINGIVQRGEPFFDTDFPKFTEFNGMTNFEWKRVGDVFSDMKMLGNDQIVQGNIADCFLITALTVLSSRPKLLEKLVLTKTCNSAGIYAFQFYRSHDNEWVTIIIDDCIPFKGKTSLFARFRNMPNVIYPMLIEKAYAKLYGGYENIVGGSVSETLLDLTGCCVEDFVIPKVSLKSIQIQKWLNYGFLVACAKVTPSGRYDHQMDGNRSIIKNHAYSVVDVKERKSRSFKGVVVTVKNPLGGENQVLYTRSPPRTRTAEPEEGRISLSFSQFKKEYNRVYCCKTNPKIRERFFVTKVKWSGGPNRIWRNPIFRVKNLAEKNTKVFATVSQRSKRHEKVMSHKLEYDMIGFSVNKTSKGMGRGIPGCCCLTYGDFKTTFKTSFWNKRDVSSDFMMQKGEVSYLVPCNYNPNSKGNIFGLKLDSVNNIEVQQMRPFVDEISIENENSEEEMEGENEVGVRELLIRKGKFSPKSGKLGGSLKSNPKAYFYVKEKTCLYVYLSQPSKPYAGVAIFVFKNSLDGKKVFVQKGYTNPNDLGLEVKVSAPCVLMVVFAQFKKGKSDYEMRIVADWNLVESYKTVEELKQRRGEEVKKLVKSGSRGSPSSGRRRGGRTRGTRGGRRTTRGRTRGGGGRATRTRGRGMQNGASMMANLYGGLE